MIHNSYSAKYVLFEVDMENMYTDFDNEIKKYLGNS